MTNIIDFPSRRPYDRLPILTRTPLTSGESRRVAPRCTPEADRWYWPAFAAFLPDGLPTGAITLIKVPAFLPGLMEWVVGDLLRSTTEAGRPCVYTPVNGSPHYPRVTEGSGAHVVNDEDVQASVIDFVSGVRHGYECGVPSLNIVQPRVAVIEQGAGPSLLVLDGIQDARPYNQRMVESETRRFGDFVVHDRGGLNRWRAADLLAYARLRTEAPTVLVWHSPLERENTDGYQALVDVSHVVIDGCDLPEGPLFLVSVRDSLDEPLPFQTPAW